MLNKIFLTGRITRDVDFRRTSSGTPVVTFTLAVENRYVLKDGNPTTDFINCIAWNKIAETMDKYVKKGNKMTIVGRLQTRNYENKDGNKVYVTEVIVEQLDLIDYNNYANNGSSEASKNDQFNSIDSDVEFNISEDDLPF